MIVQALCLCMLVADGGPAHHWQAADRQGHEAEACRALLNTLAHKASDELTLSIEHKNKATWGSVVYLVYI